jgi:hypothetical protein
MPRGGKLKLPGAALMELISMPNATGKPGLSRSKLGKIWIGLQSIHSCQSWVRFCKEWMILILNTASLCPTLNPCGGCGDDCPNWLKLGWVSLPFSSTRQAPLPNYLFSLHSSPNSSCRMPQPPEAIVRLTSPFFLISSQNNHWFGETAQKIMQIL